MLLFKCVCVTGFSEYCYKGAGRTKPGVSEQVCRNMQRDPAAVTNPQLSSHLEEGQIHPPQVYPNAILCVCLP